MSFKTIANRRAPRVDVPPLGIRMGNRSVMHGKRYLYITIGHVLAEHLGYKEAKEPIQLMIGEEEHKGQIAINRNEAGDFHATRQKNGTYHIAIKATAYGGYLNDDFETFTCEEVQRDRPEGAHGNSRMSMFILRTPNGVAIP